jgi:predicted nucleic acid-binding protein
MMSYAPAPLADRKTLVIDARLAIKAILPLADQGQDILNKLAGWHREQVRLVVPEIWLPEVVSIIRKAIYTHILSQDEGRIAIEDVFRLGVEVIPSAQSLCQQALAWAERLGQSKAHDSFYLALAERLGAGLWTSHRRLYNTTQQFGIKCVRSM